MTSYNYTTGNSLTGGVTRAYSYDTNKRLTSVTENGVTQSISGYDALGNPSSYKGKMLTWTRGRMLASSGSDSYLYDMDGVRQEKTVNGVTHAYYTDGTKILAEKVGDKVFEYYYDAQGIIGFKYDGNVYYYKKNLLGDIDRIYDANKNLVAEYKYDAWGNHRIYTSGGIDITEDMSYNSSVAKLNPFRYRGYYYDTETGLYYLNSRYYDPSIGRFINADDISYIQPTDINGLNLYAYCGNNPVMYTDPDGKSWSSFWNSVGNWFKNNWQWFVGGAIIIGSAVLTVVTAGGFAAAGGALLSVFTSTMAVNATAAIFAGAFVGSSLLAGVGIIAGGMISTSNGGSFSDGAKWGFMFGAAVGAIIGGAWGGTHYALQAAGKMPVKVNINSLINNPADEFVTLGPKDGGIAEYVRTISETGKYGRIYVSKLNNGLYQIANGHHRVAALRQLGYRFINVFFTL